MEFPSEEAGNWRKIEKWCWMTLNMNEKMELDEKRFDDEEGLETEILRERERKMEEFQSKRNQIKVQFDSLIKIYVRAFHSILLFHPLPFISLLSIPMKVILFVLLTHSMIFLLSAHFYSSLLSILSPSLSIHFIARFKWILVFVSVNPVNCLHAREKKLDREIFMSWFQPEWCAVI